MFDNYYCFLSQPKEIVFNDSAAEKTLQLLQKVSCPVGSSHQSVQTNKYVKRLTKLPSTQYMNCPREFSSTANSARVSSDDYDWVEENFGSVAQQQEQCASATNGSAQRFNVGNF